MGASDKKKSIKHRWMVRNVLLVGLSILTGFFVAATVLTVHSRDTLLNSLQMRASTSAVYINKYMNSSYDQFYDYAQRAAQEFVDRDLLEMQVLDNEGRVMFSSNGLTAGFLQTSGDVKAALQLGNVSPYIGWDDVTESRIAAVTAPVFSVDKELLGGVRMVSSTVPLIRELTSLYLALGIAAVGLIALVVGVNQLFLRSIITPIMSVSNAAAEVAGGNYGYRVPVPSEDEIGELCSTINHMSLELQRADAAKNEFISSVSHELRTPLTAIGGWAEAIAADPSDQENAAAGLEIIVKESRRLSQMVNELLDFSRLEAGGLKLQPEVFDLGAELDDAVLTYDDLLRSNGMQVAFQEPEMPVLVYGDRDRIRQVFLNLIDNACKYGKDGGQLDVSLTLEGQMARAAFRDHGQGIPAEELPKIKTKFFKGSARGRGTGIGLALCDEIVTMHRGRLEIDSTYGQGTTVTVCLPLYKAEDKKEYEK